MMWPTTSQCETGPGILCTESITASLGVIERMLSTTQLPRDAIALPALIPHSNAAYPRCRVRITFFSRSFDHARTSHKQVQTQYSPGTHLYPLRKTTGAIAST